MFNSKNKIEELKGLPQSSTGSPLPRVISDEGNIFLAYICEDETTAVVRFKSYRNYKFGFPNDETLCGHPLYAKGLRQYGIYNVKNSTWIEELKKINSVHPYHDKKRFDAYKHFIFTFHDSTFECVAEGLEFNIKETSLKTTLKELAEGL